MKRYHIYALALVLLAGCSGTRRGIVKVNQAYGGKFEILSTRIGAGETVYVLRGTDGIFSFDIEPGTISSERVTFVLKDQRKLTSLSLARSFNDWTPLYDAKSPATGAPPGMPASTARGVSVRQDDGDFHVTFTDAGIDILERGGRFQVIDEWRR